MMGCVVPSISRLMRALTPAGPVRAWRRSRRSPLLNESMPWPYSTAGIWPSARNRRLARLPVVRPVKAVRMMSVMAGLRGGTMTGPAPQDGPARQSTARRPDHHLRRPAAPAVAKV